MVENAEKMKKNGLSEADPDGVTAAKGGAGSGDSVSLAVDSQNRVSIFMRTFLSCEC